MQFGELGRVTSLPTPLCAFNSAIAQLLFDPFDGFQLRRLRRYPFAVLAEGSSLKRSQKGKYRWGNRLEVGEQ